jgi:hypothetical protein
VPREMRTAFYGGLAVWLMIANVAVVVVVYSLAAKLPPTVSAALLLLTPLYFLTSLWGSARERAGQIAMVLGILLGPILHVAAPGFDLPAAGLVGGGLAYAIHRLSREAAS